MKRTPPWNPVQLSLPLEPVRPGLRVIDGGGQRRPPERLNTPEAVMRVLIEAGADVLLRRITPERAHEIEKRVTRLMALFEGAKSSAPKQAQLHVELEALERLMSETRLRKKAR